MKPSYYPGDRVAVENYRKRPAVWEAGEVLSTEVSWRDPDRYRISYRVKLDRKTPGGRCLFLCVGMMQLTGAGESIIHY